MTEVLLKLVPIARSRLTLVVGLSGVQQALELVAAMRALTQTLQSAEIVFADGVRLAGELFGTRSVLRRAYPCELLLELVSDRAHDPLIEIAGVALAQFGVEDDAAVSDNESTRAEFWAMRERHPELVVRLGGPRKLDVSVPLRAVPQLESLVRTAIGRVPGLMLRRRWTTHEIFSAFTGALSMVKRTTLECHRRTLCSIFTINLPERPLWY